MWPLRAHIQLVTIKIKVQVDYAFEYSSLLDNKVNFENTYCNCSGHYGGMPPWCGQWARDSNVSFCILNGRLKSRLCPGAKRLKISGEVFDEYFSSDPSVCKRAARRYHSMQFLSYI